ncbi:MAG: CBS domain-containing protein [Planctomycetota bacterium]|jgi:CBS domain-containing protein
MATVADYMAKRVITFTPDTDIHRAIKVLLKRHLSGAPVVDAEGRLVGMLSKKDCLQIAFNAGYHRQWAGRVGEYMRTEVETVPPDMDIVAAAELFLARAYRRFPVMDGDRLVGLISRHDVLKALEDLW